MKRLSIALLVLAVVAGMVLFATRPRPSDIAAVAAYEADATNGERLFHAGGCASCHGEDLSGGVEFHTAFGTFRAPNISPDPKAGIGGWSDLDLANAMMRYKFATLTAFADSLPPLSEADLRDAFRKSLSEHEEEMQS